MFQALHTAVYCHWVSCVQLARHIANCIVYAPPPRALLQNAMVLALDEATANVDRATDALIQEALTDFAHAKPSSGRVLMVIAHRIDTIMDCDQLLVLSNGVLKENGPPRALAAKPGGMFASMVEAATAAASNSGRDTK